MAARPSYPPHALGAWGEREAARRLVRAGWRLLARNYRFGRREIDLVVRLGRLVAFVEVKTRAGGRFGPPEEAVTGRKRREIERVARDFLHRSRLGDVDVRFDVVGIVVDRSGRIVRYTHVEDAWRPSAR